GSPYRKCSHCHGLSGPAVRRPLPDAEDHKLGWPERGYPDEADEPPVIEIILGHRRAVTPHKVGRLRLLAQEVTGFPLVEQKIFHSAAHSGPQLLTVVFKHHPLRAPLNGALEEGKIAP